MTESLWNKCDNNNNIIIIITVMFLIADDCIAGDLNMWSVSVCASAIREVEKENVLDQRSAQTELGVHRGFGHKGRLYFSNF